MQNLETKIWDASHITGSFTLRSGQVSGEYLDKYLFEAQPGLLGEIAGVMMPLIPDGAQILAGLEMGGIPIVTVLSQRTGIPTAFVRKKAKEYGTCKLAEGAPIDGKRVCVIEDVVTSGGQIIASVRELRQRGAVVDTVLCVILRNPDAAEKLAGHGLALRPAFTMEEIRRAKEGTGHG